MELSQGAALHVTAHRALTSSCAMLTSALRNNGSQESSGNPKSGQLPRLDRKRKSRQILHGRKKNQQQQQHKPIMQCLKWRKQILLTFSQAVVWILICAWTALPLLCHSLCKRHNPDIGRLECLGFIQHIRGNPWTWRPILQHRRRPTLVEGVLNPHKRPNHKPSLPGFCYCTEQESGKKINLLLDSKAVLA